MSSHSKSLVTNHRPALQDVLFTILPVLTMAILVVVAGSVVETVETPSVQADGATTQRPQATVVVDDDGRLTVAPPTLTDVQRLKLLTVTQRIEIAVLKAQAAQKDFEAAVAERAELLRAYAVDGYELDGQTLTYRARQRDEAKPKTE